MADDRRDRFPPPPPPPPPPRGQYNNQYPPPPIEEEDRQSRVVRDPRDLRDAPNAVTLPSIQDYPPSGPSRGPPPALEPGARGSYSVSPDQGAYPPPRPSYSLPPVQSLADGRAFDNRAPDSRGPPPPPPPPQQDPRQPMAYRPVPPPDANAYYRGPPPPGPPPPPYVQDPYQQQYAAYPQPQVGIMGYDYRTGPGMQQQQASAPRQRTSIACRYCRKRKIRCSGYQTTADGKCLNCKKTGNECVFQPVSSGSTAFVPVQAIQGGVIAPGTQLFGAFGQPLPMGAPQGPPMPMQMPGQGPPPRHTPPQLPLPSPTGSYYEDRVETGRRRPRGPEDDHHGPRLPPPHPGQIEEDPRRRSPASPQSASPPSLYQVSSYPPRPASNTPPAAAPYPAAERSTTYPPRLESPPAPPPTAGPSTSSNSSSVMSLGNLMDNAPPRTAPGSSNGESRDNIDNFMLGRLGRRS